MHQHQRWLSDSEVADLLPTNAIRVASNATVKSMTPDSCQSGWQVDLRTLQLAIVSHFELTTSEPAPIPRGRETPPPVETLNVLTNEDATEFKRIQSAAFDPQAMWFSGNRIRLSRGT
jgi:hypothetical protein